MEIQNDNYNFHTPFTNITNKINERNQLEINNEYKKLNITKDSVEININNYPSQYDIGYRNPKDFIQEFSEESLQEGINAIGKKARSGDMLMHFQENNISDIVEKEREEEPEQVQLAYRRSPDIEVIPGNLNMDFKY